MFQLLWGYIRENLGTARTSTWPRGYLIRNQSKRGGSMVGGVQLVYDQEFPLVQNSILYCQRVLKRGKTWSECSELGNSDFWLVALSVERKIGCTMEEVDPLKLHKASVDWEWQRQCRKSEESLDKGKLEVKVPSLETWGDCGAQISLGETGLGNVLFEILENSSCLFLDNHCRLSEQAHL